MVRDSVIGMIVQTFARSFRRATRENPPPVLELPVIVGCQSRHEISDALPFGRLWYGESKAISNAVGYAMHYSRSADAVIRVYDAAGNVVETQEHKGDFCEP